MLGRVMEELVGSGWSQLCGRALHAVHCTGYSTIYSTVCVCGSAVRLADDGRHCTGAWRHCHRRTD